MGSKGHLEAFGQFQAWQRHWPKHWLKHCWVIIEEVQLEKISLCSFQLPRSSTSIRQSSAAAAVLLNRLTVSGIPLYSGASKSPSKWKSKLMAKAQTRKDRNPKIYYMKKTFGLVYWNSSPRREEWN